MEKVSSRDVCHGEMSLLENLTDEKEALAQWKSSDIATNGAIDSWSLLPSRSADKENQKLARLRACVSLEEYSPAPSASFTLNRPSWVEMEDIEVGATIRRKKRARKSLSRETVIEKTIIIQEEPLVYCVKEDSSGESEETKDQQEEGEDHDPQKESTVPW